MSATSPNGPVPIESRALGTLRYIRASIDAAGTLAVPGMAGIVMGGIGIAAAVLSSLPEWRDQWLAIWIVAAVAACALGGLLVVRQAAQAGRLPSPVRKFMLCLCPALLAGAILTFALWRNDGERLIPGTWLLLYGCAVLPASTATRPANMQLIAIMGGLFVVLGVLGLALPPATHTLLLGAGFGALHLLFGILIGRRNHGSD